jgi:hypothetical protein
VLFELEAGGEGSSKGTEQQVKTPARGRCLMENGAGSEEGAGIIDMSVMCLVYALEL